MLNIVELVELAGFSYVISALLGFFTFYFARKRLMSFIFGQATLYINDFLHYLEQKPEILTQIMEKPAISLATKITADMQSKIPQIVGNVVEGGVEAGMKYIPREFRGIVAIAQMFLNKGQNTPRSGSSGSNPFD